MPDEVVASQEEPSHWAVFRRENMAAHVVHFCTEAEAAVAAPSAEDDTGTAAPPLAATMPLRSSSA